MNDRELTLRKLSAIREEIADKYKITSLALFGSMARGDNTPVSDIDLLVDFSSVPDLLTFIELEERLTGVLGRNVDLVPRRKLRAELIDRITIEAVAI